MHKDYWTKSLVLLGCLFSTFTLAQTFDLPADSASFAVMVYDYESGLLEGGSVVNVSPDLISIPDTIPLIKTRQPPADFGWMKFDYELDSLTLFYGTIVWAGQGEILIPDSLLPVESFEADSMPIERPQNLVYWNYTGEVLTEDSLIQSGTRAWENAKLLAITHQFADDFYQAVIYFYPPAVGALDPTVAKWIVFLYRNPFFTGIREESPSLYPQEILLLSAYPNPFNPTTPIRYSIPENSPVTVTIYDQQGRQVNTLVNAQQTVGDYELPWNGTDASGRQLSSGLYFCQVQAGRFTETMKLVLLK